MRCGDEKGDFRGFRDFSLTPCTRVVRLERERQPSVRRKHSSVSAGRVVVVEVVDVTFLPSLLAGAEDVEVMAVQIYRRSQRFDQLKSLHKTRLTNRMRNLNVVGVSSDRADDPVDPLALVRELDEVRASGGAVDLVVLDIVESGLLPVSVQGRTVDVPVEGQSAVGGSGLVEPGVEGSDVVRDLTRRDVGVPVGSQTLLISAALGVLAARADRGFSLVAFVGEDGQDVAVHGVATAASLVLDLGAEPVATSGLVGVDDDIVALTDTEEDPVGGVRNNRNKVGGDDLHLVTIQRDHVVVVDGHVDQTDAVLLVLLQGGPLVLTTIAADHLAVDKSGVGSRGRTVKVGNALRKGGHSVVVPVRDRERTHVLVVVGSGGTLDNNRTDDTVTVLAREVRVVPGRTVLGGLEGVGLLLAWCDGALGDTGHTVLSVLVVLAETVPVDGRAVVGHFVLDGNLDHVTPVGLDSRARVLAVDGKDLTLETIRCHGDVGDGPVVTNGAAGVRPVAVEVGIDREVAIPAFTRSRAIGTGWLGSSRRLGSTSSALPCVGSCGAGGAAGRYGVAVVGVLLPLNVSVDVEKNVLVFERGAGWHVNSSRP